MTKFPADWPQPGPIDLARHDPPHASSTTEWWYTNGHGATEAGRRYSFFAAFFRQVKGRDPQTGELRHAHSVTWAIQDLDGEKMHTVSNVDQSAAREGLLRMNRGLGSKDSRLNRALREILERGNVPTPDKVFASRVFVNLERLELDYAGDRFLKQEDGSYRLELFSRDKGVGCNLTFQPLKPPTRQGNDGVVRGSDDETLFYYYIPRCKVTGTVIEGGREQTLTEASGWYDHEFGVGHEDDWDDEAEARMAPDQLQALHAARRERIDQRQVGWDWLSTQLDDGSELACYKNVYTHTGKSAGNWAILVDAKGERHKFDDLSLEPVEWWKSSQTFFDYPSAYRVSIPSAKIELEVKAAFEDQEFITLISKPSFWEGRVEVTGTKAGKPVSGPGFIERMGFAPFETLDGFFEEVGKMVRKSVREVLPLEPTYKQALGLIASEDKEQYMRGVNLEQYARTHIKPIREIVDRGGKGWRSYAAITCCDIVGGDSRGFVQWLALPEMMHVGSLIVDDVQDRSITRRGGKSAHLIYGEAQAINSGTAAYFICHRLLTSDKVSDADQLRLYELYFDALRAGHAGQAIDLDGFDDLVPLVVESGDSKELEERVLAVHRLKTAAPAGCLARMGAIGGGGTKEQVNGLGVFFEELGLAFQIIDDVLNLRGFKGDLKAKAEDVMQGKVTLPVVKAFSRLEKHDRRWLLETLQTKPQDPCVVQMVVAKLEACGAIEACADDARALVEQGWERLQPLVGDSLAKLMLRAFGWYVLERHY